MRYDSPIETLLENAALGVNSAWREIMGRYTPLVLSVCRCHGILGPDADDVAGAVWLSLLTHLDTIREPAALPGWLRTTARHECLTRLRARNREIPDDREIGDRTEPAADESVLVRERCGAVRAAFAGLPSRDRALLAMLFSDPPTPYAQISTSLGMPIGAIGPTRRRCLDRVRGDPAIAALLAGEPEVHGD